MRKRLRRKLTEGWTGAIVYAVLGIVIAFLVNQLLAFALSTDLPVVAVVSSSMQHDNAEQTHYRWLEDKFGYDRSYVDSWPMPTGFLIGDMPIVAGTDEYGVGDVIVYTAPGQNFPIIHRIVRINSDGTYQTKGDNNSNQFPYEFAVSDEQIHGRVIFIVPKLGYFKVLITKIFGAW